MIRICIHHPESAPRHELIHDHAAVIGKGSDCRLRLPGWKVGREHARIYRSADGLYIQDLGQFFGTLVNGRRIQQHGPLRASDQVMIGGFTLSIEEAASQDGDRDPQRKKSTSSPPSASTAAELHTNALLHYWRKRLHEALLDAIDLRRRDLARMSDEELRVEAAQLLGELIEAEGELPAELDPALLLREVLNEAVGLGPLEELLADDSVSEIMVNRHDEIYLERNGLLQRHPGSFTSARAVLGVIERIVTPLGRRIDEASPMVDARLKDGSRVNAIIPPLALKGPALTIRKFGHRLLEIDRLIEAGSLSPAMAAFMELCVLQRRNVLISGGTGSGKTTLLNILSNFIPSGERIITIEDAAELRLLHPHLISLESRPANAEGRGEVSIRELVKNALRMRPDRIVVGECRGGEALDMLQAMNTGHDGSLTTLHANSARDALARLETLVLMAGMDLPLAAIREQIASAIDIVIQQARLADGRRVVTAIVEVTGTESGHIQIQPLFHHEQSGRDESGRIQSRFSSSGTIPAFCESLRAAGVEVDLSLFDRETSATERC